MKAKNYQYSLEDICQHARNLGNEHDWSSTGVAYVASTHTQKKLYEAFQKENYQRCKKLVCEIALAVVKKSAAPISRFRLDEAIFLLEAALKSPLADTENNYSLKDRLFRTKPYQTDFNACIKQCKKIHEEMQAKHIAEQFKQNAREKIYGVYRAKTGK